MIAFKMANWFLIMSNKQFILLDFRHIAHSVSSIVIT